MIIFLRFNVCFVKFLGRKAKGVRRGQIFILGVPTLLIQLPFLRETVCIVKNKDSTLNLLPSSVPSFLTFEIFGTPNAAQIKAFINDNPFSCLRIPETLRQISRPAIPVFQSLCLSFSSPFLLSGNVLHSRLPLPGELAGKAWRRMDVRRRKRRETEIWK